MANVIVPPIKSQGIKTKLVPWINDLILTSGASLNGRWIEPFFGTGVVGFNSPMRGTHIVGDTNPHIINFYRAMQSGEITQYTMRAYLERESHLLAHADDNGYAHFRLVRDRFNCEHSPYDFIFLSRAGFNGMMRFNRHGDWNIPFCKKPDRFAPAYITKICNQIEHVAPTFPLRKPSNVPNQTTSSIATRPITVAMSTTTMVGLSRTSMICLRLLAVPVPSSSSLLGITMNSDLTRWLNNIGTILTSQHANTSTMAVAISRIAMLLSKPSFSISRYTRKLRPSLSAS